jgi:mono/diheme cytochrome c family protein
VLSGCSSKPDYPVTLSFPSRADRLVLKVPEANPTSPGAPGKLDAEIAQLDSIGGKTLEPASLPANDRTGLDQFLREIFGAPSAPTVVLSGDAEVAAAAERLGLASDQLAAGGKLFRKHCQNCHGLPGDGRGPAGLWINPYPRDFRRGFFKFVSTGEGTKPRRADLMRTITEGLKGTPMPAFGLQPEADRDLVARYATYLAIRGQTEFETLAELGKQPGSDPRALAAAKLKESIAQWEKAEQAAAIPPAPADGDPGTPAHQEAVRRGYQLFIAKTDTECLKCHGDFGRKPLLRYDLWGTIAKPADFTTPGHKGGSRHEDLFARVRWGIPAVGMPAHPTLSERQVWDLVRFVRSAPYPRELPQDVRDAVYPNP